MTRVDDHVVRFNRAVRTGDWAGFTDSLTEDARLVFDGVPVGPFDGRDAILRAYREQPPDDTITVRSVATAGDTDRVRFGWDAGGSGTMLLRWRDDRVTLIHVTFT